MDKIVTFRADSCIYNLVYPYFFLSATKAALVELFKSLFWYDGYRENEEAIRFFDTALPVLKTEVEVKFKERISAAEKKLSERRADYEREYLDPNMSRFPANWSKRKKVAERDARKKWNKDLVALVKEAETSLEWAKKEAAQALKHAERVITLYQAAKVKYQ